MNGIITLVFHLVPLLQDCQFSFVFLHILCTQMTLSWVRHLQKSCAFLLYCFVATFLLMKMVNFQDHGTTDENQISLCSSDEIEGNLKPLEDMLLAEPDLSRLGRQDKSLRVSYFWLTQYFGSHWNEWLTYSALEKCRIIRNHWVYYKHIYGPHPEGEDVFGISHSTWYWVGDGRDEGDLNSHLTDVYSCSHIKKVNVPTYWSSGCL